MRTSWSCFKTCPAVKKCAQWAEPEKAQGWWPQAVPALGGRGAERTGRVSVSSRWEGGRSQQPVPPSLETWRQTSVLLAWARPPRGPQPRPAALPGFPWGLSGPHPAPGPHPARMAVLCPLSLGGGRSPILRVPAETWTVASNTWGPTKPSASSHSSLPTWVLCCQGPAASPQSHVLKP